MRVFKFILISHEFCHSHFLSPLKKQTQQHEDTAVAAAAAAAAAAACSALISLWWWELGGAELELTENHIYSHATCAQR